MLIRYRFRRDTIRVGETVTVEGFLARDGSKLANGKTVNEIASGSNHERG
jgi:primosomal replication protein N